MHPTAPVSGTRNGKRKNIVWCATNQGGRDEL